jgi:hypothetical protein
MRPCNSFAGVNSVEINARISAPAGALTTVRAWATEIVRIRFQTLGWIVRLAIMTMLVELQDVVQAIDLYSNYAKTILVSRTAVTNAFLTKTARPDTASLIQAQTPQ